MENKVKEIKHKNDKRIEEKFKGKNPLDEVLDQLKEYEEGTTPKEPDRCC